MTLKSYSVPIRSNCAFESLPVKDIYVIFRKVQELMELASIYMQLVFATDS